MTDGDELDLDLLAQTATGFRRRVVELAPDQVLRFDAAAWKDTIVVLTAGEIELECSSGERRRFGRGAILCLARLPLSFVRNSGPEPARLLAISRGIPEARHSG
jgi:hypothetical protein